LDNFTEQINQILNDPGSMQQIMELASALGIDPNAAGENQSANGIPKGFAQALNHAKEREEKQQALVRALLPYLRPGHQKRLERAIQIARLSHFAGAALTNRDEKTAKEASYDV